MARHRKSTAVGWRAGPLVLALGLSAFASGAGMGYVWHRNRNAQLSRQIREVTARLESLRSGNLILDRQLEELRSPRALEAAVQRWKLELVMPHPEQILRIPEGRPDAAIASPRLLRMAARQP